MTTATEGAEDPPRPGCPTSKAALARYDYVAVGHVTVDLLAGDRSQPGGAAFYSGLQAARMGLRTLVVTQGDPLQIDLLLEPYRGELDVVVTSALHTTTLQTWTAGGARRQRILAWAGPISSIPLVEASILHVAPVAREITPAVWSTTAAFVGLTPQGLVRRWPRGGEISPVTLDATTLNRRLDAAVVNAAELSWCRELLDRTRRWGSPVIAVTAGSEPALIHLADGTLQRVMAYPLDRHRDDLGAGDVFAAAFFISLYEGLPPGVAAVRGSAAAALRIADDGPDAIADRSAIDALARPPHR